MRISELFTQSKTLHLSSHDFAVFCEQLQEMLLLNLTITDALEQLTKYGKQSIRDFSRSVYANISEFQIPLSDAIDRVGCVPKTSTEQIRTAEHGGQVPEILGVIVKEDSITMATKSSIKSAIIGPSITFGFALVIVLIIMTFVMPKMITMLLSMNAKVPTVTRILMNICKFLQVWSLPSLACIIIGVFIYNIYAKKNDITFFLDLFEKIPGLKIILCNNEYIRFYSNMGYLLKAGYPSSSAFENAIKTIKSKSLRNRFERAYTDYSLNGLDFISALANYSCVSHIHLQSLSLSEMGGNLDTGMLNIATVLTERNTILAKRMEPILGVVSLLIVAIPVIFICFALYLPQLALTLAPQNM